MSKTNNYPALPERGSRAYILTKELQRIRRFGVSDIVTRPQMYPELQPLVMSKVGREPVDLREQVVLCIEVFRAAFERLPSSNLRRAAAILFHLDPDSVAPPLEDRRRAADNAYADRNSARHIETVRRTLERDIDHLLVEIFPRLPSAGRPARSPAGPGVQEHDQPERKPRRPAVVGITAAAAWMAWYMWRENAVAVHERDIPADYLGGLRSHPHVLRDEDGYLCFSERSLVDAAIAQCIFDDLTEGSERLILAAQTTHRCDLRIGQLVAAEDTTMAILGRWMCEGATPILRVNAAGILAKTGKGSGDDVVQVLRGDPECRQLYLTAVAARVLGLPWNKACEFARLHQAPAPLVTSWPSERRIAAVAQLAAELNNRRDVGARWCSAVLLEGVQDAAPAAAKQALGRAAQEETCMENLRTFAAVLAGHP